MIRAVLIIAGLYLVVSVLICIAVGKAIADADRVQVRR